MGFFDFFKPKKTPMQEIFEKMSNQLFPKGDKDINAGTDELLFILKNKIDRETSKSIFIKSMSISKIAEKFDEERLRMHLSGYCLQHFTADQVKKFYGYITALNAAMMIHRKTPSEVKRDGDSYFW